jgi:hypothetical protein
VGSRDRRSQSTFAGRHYPLWVLWCLSIAASGVFDLDAKGHGFSDFAQTIRIALFALFVVSSLLLIWAWWADRKYEG